MNILNKIKNQFINVYYYIKYAFIKKNMFHMLSNEELVALIVNEKKSLCRFGDGELRLCFIDGSVRFQRNNKKMQNCLKKVLMNEDENSNIIIGQHEALNNLKGLVRGAKIYWMKFIVNYYDTIIKKLPINQLYGPANITRPYMDYKNKSKLLMEDKFNLIKKIWDKRDILIVEGEFTRLGIGNDLLDNCNSIERIICPTRNAFSKYDEICNAIRENDKEKLVLIALGPTATVLAYELSQEGYQCVDIGHIDVEYIWFKNGCKKKEQIEGKYVGEVDGMSNQSLADKLEEKKYLAQIIKKILIEI